MTSSNSASLYITQIRFCRALAVVRALPKESHGKFNPSTFDKLNFYGLYKQALVGDCMLLKPSARNIVQYAKWKAWDKLRGISPIDAQIMYINALIQLLKQFINQYPDSELIDSLVQSVNYLEETEEDTATKDENLVQWDTNEQENEEYYLGEIDKDQILSENHQYNNSYYSSTIVSEFPTTPEPLIPKYSHSKRSVSSSISSLQYHYHDQNSTYLDKEAATTTSSLNLSDHQPKKRNHSNKKAAIKTLQLEVAALCEEIDHLRKKNSTRHLIKWRWLWFFKSIAKHAFFNFLILTMLFIVLWRRKSPIAYAVISYAGPRLKDFMYYLFNHIVYWKITV